MLWIISPVNATGPHSDFTSSSQNGNLNTGNQTSYTCIFLYILYSHSGGSRLTYTTETWTQNRYFWIFNVNLRDNSILRIGTIFRVLDPLPVERFMEGDIPLLVSKVKAVIFKSQYTYFLVSFLSDPRQHFICIFQHWYKYQTNWFHTSCKFLLWFDLW